MILVVTLAIFVAFAVGLFCGALMSYVKEEDLLYEQAEEVARRMDAM